jgi:hypothetical protein
MGKIEVIMSKSEYTRYLAFKEADRVVRSIKKGIKESQEARNGKRVLKSAYQLANEL